MEPEGSLPYSQAPATLSYPEPTPSSPHNPLYTAYKFAPDDRLIQSETRRASNGK